MSKEFKIGLVVLSSIFLFVWGINYMAGNNILKSQRIYYAVYKQINGLMPANEVTLNGGRVGRVNNRILTEDGYWVVEFAVDNEAVVLKDSTIATIGSSGLLGGMAIQLNNIDAGTKVLESGDTLNGVLAKSIEDEVQGILAPLKDKTEKLLGSVDTLVISLSTVLNEETQKSLQRSFIKIPKAIENLVSATESVDSIADGLKNARIQDIINNVASITGNLKRNNGQISSILENLDNITDSLRAANLKETIANVDNVLMRVDTLLEKANRGEGTLGKLLNDDQLYNDLTLASKDLDMLILDIQQNPKRYLNVSLMNFGGRKQAELKRPCEEYKKLFGDSVPCPPQEKK